MSHQLTLRKMHLMKPSRPAMLLMSVVNMVVVPINQCLSAQSCITFFDSTFIASARLFTRSQQQPEIHGTSAFLWEVSRVNDREILRFMENIQRNFCKFSLSTATFKDIQIQKTFSKFILKFYFKKSSQHKKNSRL